MNNTMCLGFFYLVCFLRGLEWEFTAEVCAMLFVIWLFAVLGSTRTTFKVWIVFPVMLLYPASLLAISILHGNNVD